MAWRRGRRWSAGKADGVSGVERYGQLEQRLVLLAWLNQQFGYRNNRDLLEQSKGAAEGFDAAGRSYINHWLKGRRYKVKIPLADLARYDDNIREHLRAVNAGRPEPITLRYFQHMALLYTEIFLDRYFHRRGEMLRSLNDFSRNRYLFEEITFSEADLKKLAFWMATGSGKTLIMHFNYRQFLHYNDRPLDNILLITPNEGLSEQHMTEMAASGVPCRRFDLHDSGLTLGGKDAVRVIEITKLTERKRGGGASVPVEAFEGNNLIFVDEGHKGSGGEAWRSFRDALGATGFTFEYSATFGQALTAARNDRLTEEYGKAIVFDYSYRYFHGDGYGKDFRILNLKEETTQDRTETLLLGNLLSFHEQQRMFDEQARALRPYNLEKPLWVFVGGTVNAVHTKDKRKRSDVLTVARFLHHVLENKGDWAVAAIEKLLAGRTGLAAPDGRDVFEGKFKYLRAKGLSPQAIYRGVLAKTLHAPLGGGLHLCGIRSAAGEIGLKASGADDYFGLIYIGDAGAFKKLVEEDDSGIVLEEDAIADSLFDGIGDPRATVDVLIGAKKFMEGWNSWRVSNMGLLNIGRKEGSEIVQLFGRGVRLRGKGFGLKRSSARDGEHPRDIGLLETLNVFAVRADYMAQFRQYLEKEGVETEGVIDLPLPIKLNEDFLNKGLVTPREPPGRSFAAEANVLLEPDRSARVRVDLSLKAQVLESSEAGVKAAKASAGEETPIPAASLDLVDWQKVYLELLEYKERKGLANLAVLPQMPRKIVESSASDRLYSLAAEEAMVAPKSFAGAALLHEAVVSILRKYMDKLYRVRKEQWDTRNMVYAEIDEKDANFQDYTIKVPRGDEGLLAEIEKLIEEAGSLYRHDGEELSRIHFDRHIYQPLLIERRSRVKSEPAALNESERLFVEDMRTYCETEMDNSLADGELYLLRNLGPGKGVGFFDTRGFYPDFILWIKSGAAQRIVFIEPHGMLFAEAYAHDDKARLHIFLRERAKAMSARSKLKNVSLDSFIVSATAFEDLRPRYDDGSWDRERFAAAHILFPERGEDYDYLKLIMAEPKQGR